MYPQRNPPPHEQERAGKYFQYLPRLPWLGKPYQSGHQSRSLIAKDLVLSVTVYMRVILRVLIDGCDREFVPRAERWKLFCIFIISVLC